MDILFLQVVLYCLLFTLLVALSFRGNAINIIYFYPKSVIDKVVEFGYTDYKTINRNKIIFYSLFIVLMFGSLILIVGSWNEINDFKQAFIQLNIFLQSWNIFDGLVMDILWTSNSKNLKIKGIKDSEYIPGVVDVIKKRIIFIPGDNSLSRHRTDAGKSARRQIDFNRLRCVRRKIGYVFNINLFLESRVKNKFPLHLNIISFTQRRKNAYNRNISVFRFH